ncbi:hypothetical protein Aph02nite_27520 [Actinoplanes philippinensis]|nr:hypothetical protein Aph02nite_27520 [Actinoplanes philippinensis]
MQVDLLPRALAEPPESGQAAGAQLDVDPVGELCPDTARGPAGGAGAELAAVQEHDVAYARLGQMEGDADADRAAADDHDLAHVSWSVPSFVDVHS